MPKFLIFDVPTGRKRGMTKARASQARTLRTNGLTVGQIAKALRVGKRTVSDYLKALRA